MLKPRSRFRKGWLEARNAIGLAPLPEEQLGLIGPDPSDARDRIKQPVDGRLLPVDLCDAFSVGIRNQGRTNACGGFSGASGAEMLVEKALGVRTRLSALDLYYSARRQKNADTGVFMRDLMAALKSQGVAIERYWRDHQDPINPPRDPMGYDVSRFKVKSYERVQGVETMQRTLSMERLPVWVGVLMFERVMADAVRTGFFETPKPRDKEAGGHAMLAVGWNCIRGRVWFKLINSWGQDVGQNGIFWMPAEYLIEGICRDAWSVGKDYF